MTEGPVWVGGKPAAVRVDAGLSADSELNWVDANVTLRYPPEAATTRAPAFASIAPWGRRRSQPG